MHTADPPRADAGAGKKRAGVEKSSISVRLPEPNRPRKGSGPVGSYVRSILMEDASGAQFQMHEYIARERVFDYVRKRARFRLDTGEEAERSDSNTFRLVRSGETLVRAGKV